jgi:iron complex transport system ATP-binding protein
MSLIEVNNLCFEYTKDNHILKDINLSIEEGTINVILGLNGSGKTTLIKLLAGLMKSTTGIILIDRKSILSMSDHERSKLIAYVPQLVTNRIAFTVKEYLTLSLSNQKNIFWSKEEYEKDEAKAVEFANRFGIGNKLDRRVDELSGGERQIAMICGALFQNAKIIILDEPTASLDIKNQYAVLQFLKECQKKEMKTIIFSCHDPNHALNLGGDMIALHEGKICLKGKSREKIKAENLKDIYGEIVCDSNISQRNYIVMKW